MLVSISIDGWWIPLALVLNGFELFLDLFLDLYEIHAVAFPVLITRDILSGFISFRDLFNLLEVNLLRLRQLLNV